MKKILIIEDEVSLAKILEDQLALADFQVTTVFDGKKALEVLKKESFDLILLDLILPLVDGFEILSELKKAKNKTPVVILSNLGQREDYEKSKDLGAVDYFIKSDVTIFSVVDFVKKFFSK